MLGVRATSPIRGYRMGTVQRFLRRINVVTVLLWTIAAGMAALMIAEYVSQKL